MYENKMPDSLYITAICYQLHRGSGGERTNPTPILQGCWKTFFLFKNFIPKMQTLGLKNPL